MLSRARTKRVFEIRNSCDGNETELG
jgi:hypothetical protein